MDDHVTHHFREMAKGKVSYCKGFKVIKQVPINAADKNLSSKPLITPITTAQANAEDTKALLKSKTHKKKASPSKRTSKEAF